MRITTDCRRSDAWAFRSLLTFPSGSFLLIASFTIIFFAIASEDQKATDDSTVLYCAGSGSVSFFTGSNPNAKILWDPSLFLSITLGFGHFTFAQAKALDFAWDLLVGSGGQAVVIALVYPFLRRALCDHLAHDLVLISTYTAMAFDRVSGSTLWAVLEELSPGLTSCLRRVFDVFLRCGKGRGRTQYQQLNKSVDEKRASRRSFLWMGLLFILMYLLSFAKVLSLITGYQAVAAPVVKDQDSGEYVSVPFADTATLQITDGSRIGLYDGFAMLASDLFYPAIISYLETSSAPWSDSESQAGVKNCTYTFGNNATACQFFSTTLNEPASQHSSNITIVLDYGLNDTKQVHLSAPPLSIVNITGPPLVRVGYRTMPQDYLVKNSQCLASTVYKWGFSSLLLFWFCISSLTFLLILQIMSWQLYEHSRSDRVEHPDNVYQDMFDITRELTDQCDARGEPDTEELKKTLFRDRQTMKLEVDNLPASRNAQRQEIGISEEVRGALSFGLSAKWYRRIAKLLNSHWAEEEVIVYWPANKAQIKAQHYTTAIETGYLVPSRAFFADSRLSTSSVSEGGDIALQNMPARTSADG